MAYEVTTASGTLEFETVQAIHIAKPLAIDTNHFIASWGGEGGDGYAQVFNVNTTTWAVTTAAARLEFDTTLGHYNQIQAIDANHFFINWSGSGNDGYAQVLTVNTSTWAVTTAAASLEWETTIGRWESMVPVDTNHFITFTEGSASDGFAVVFAVNTTTWAVTTTSVLEFDTRNAQFNAAAKIDTNHFINFWAGGATAVDGFAQVFTVNTTTWAVTTAASSFLWSSAVAPLNTNTYKIDTNHFLTFWQDQPSTDGFAQVFTVNTTTWAVTTAAASLEFDTQDFTPSGNGSISRVDTNHFLFTWGGADTAAGATQDGFAQVFEVNTTTWAVTTSAASLEFDTTEGEYPTTSEAIAGTTTKHLLLYSGSGDDGFATVLDVAVPSSGTTVTPGVGSLTLSTFAPTVTVSDHKTATPSTASLTLTTFAPSVVVNTIVTPTVASLTLTTFAPTVSVSDNKLVTPDTASLTLTTFAPTVTATDNQFATPGTASLTLTGYAPTVTINHILTPSTASLTLSTFAPMVAISDNKSVTPSTASLTLTGYAPTVLINQIITPSTASLTLSTFAPTVGVSDNKSVTPDTASLTLTGFAPTVSVSSSSDTEVIPDTASLTLTGLAPTVSISDNKSAVPGTASLSLTGYAPTVSVTDNYFAIPGTASLTLTTFAPTVTTTHNVTVVPDIATLLLTTYAPTVRVGAPPAPIEMKVTPEGRLVMYEDIPGGLVHIL